MRVEFGAKFNGNDFIVLLSGEVAKLPQVDTDFGIFYVRKDKCGILVDSDLLEILARMASLLRLDLEVLDTCTSCPDLLTDFSFRERIDETV